MKDVLMLATVPNTTAGTLREGKPYHLDDELAARLVAGGYARAAHQPETATREPPSNAARRTTRVKGRTSRSKGPEPKDEATETEEVSDA